MPPSLECPERNDTVSNQQKPELNPLQTAQCRIKAVWCSLFRSGWKTRCRRASQAGTTNKQHQVYSAVHWLCLIGRGVAVIKTVLRSVGL